MYVQNHKKLKKAYRMANSADPDQTAPQGTVSSGLHCWLGHSCLKT